MIINCKKEWRTIRKNSSRNTFKKIFLLDQRTKKSFQINSQINIWQIYRDKFSDREDLEETEIIYYVNFAEVDFFCNKKGIYVDYN